MGSQIVYGHTASSLLDHACDSFSYLALVKNSLASLDDRAQSVRQAMIMENFTCAGGTPIDHQLRPARCVS
jgi:hypothetical protein